uniref:ATP synthase F0 subunit 8 n=1 Tax=Elthusa poutassouiensis TaxID=3104314 RepID=UPI002E798B68|nr:ATP synthase F0 subunit 8 [Elthusa poutassouiensis]WPS93549.1 ATP synthase F0 subunit 8 [Elthusa poutassouiensis]
MPQMAPMMWSIFMPLWVLSILIISSLIHFSNPSPLKDSPFFKTPTVKTWKW